jgi:hypothetical protein
LAFQAASRHQAPLCAHVLHLPARGRRRGGGSLFSLLIYFISLAVSSAAIAGPSCRMEVVYLVLCAMQPRLCGTNQVVYGKRRAIHIAAAIQGGSEAQTEQELNINWHDLLSVKHTWLASPCKKLYPIPTAAAHTHTPIHSTPRRASLSTYRPSCMDSTRKVSGIAHNFSPLFSLSLADRPSCFASKRPCPPCRAVRRLEMGARPRPTRPPTAARAASRGDVTRAASNGRAQGNLCP